METYIQNTFEPPEPNRNSPDSSTERANRNLYILYGILIRDILASNQYREEELEDKIIDWMNESPYYDLYYSKIYVLMKLVHLCIHIREFERDIG
jgi:hypothetical protein